MKTQFFVTLAALAVSSTMALAGGPTPAPEGASVYFVNLEDGQTVSSPVQVIFGLSGMGVAPAGIEKENTGHHHLLINRPALGETDEGAEEMLYPIMNDDNHRHFGGGQTEVTLDLPAGEHTLQLVMGDWSHVPHTTPVASDRITITVE